MNGESQLTVYRRCVPVVDALYDRESNRTVVEVLLDALAEAEGVTVTELPPLFDTIDPETLTQLFDRRGGKSGVETVLGFTLDSWNVFVRSDGRIRVCDGTRSTDPEPVFETLSS